jgi:hypothetical protein
LGGLDKSGGIFHRLMVGPTKPAGRVPPDAFLFIQAATKRKQKVPCHCVGHAVTDGQRRLKTLESFHGGSNFFARPLFRELISKIIGPTLFPTVIEGVAGFKNQQRNCNVAAFPSAVRACEPLP